MYDYRESMRNDIKEYFEELVEWGEVDGAYPEEVFDNVYDKMWIADSVTGNASGSYFCNSYKAKECVIDNIDLLNEAFYEFGCDSTEVGERFLNEEWEYFDVTIRCYLLASCLSEVLEEMN